MANLLSITGGDGDGDINLEDLFSEAGESTVHTGTDALTPEAFSLGFDLGHDDTFLTNVSFKPVNPKPLNPPSSAKCPAWAPARMAIETSHTTKSGTKREALSPPVERLELPSVVPTIDDKFRGRSSVPGVGGPRETSHKRMRSNVRTLPLLSFPDSCT
jgi:hypothetical protein